MEVDIRISLDSKWIFDQKYIIFIVDWATIKKNKDLFNWTEHRIKLLFIEYFEVDHLIHDRKKIEKKMFAIEELNIT